MGEHLSWFDLLKCAFNENHNFNFVSLLKFYGRKIGPGEFINYVMRWGDKKYSKKILNPDLKSQFDEGNKNAVLIFLKTPFGQSPHL